MRHQKEILPGINKYGRNKGFTLRECVAQHGILKRKDSSSEEIRCNVCTSQAPFLQIFNHHHEALKIGTELASCGPGGEDFGGSITERGKDLQPVPINHRVAGVTHESFCCTEMCSAYNRNGGTNSHKCKAYS